MSESLKLPLKQRGSFNFKGLSSQFDQCHSELISESMLLYLVQMLKLIQHDSFLDSPLIIDVFAYANQISFSEADASCEANF